MYRCRSMNKEKVAIRRKSSREKKIALQQDVDKLKKKLRHEENVHRALERAFTRPLGALPRLPPYLPPYTLELLAEVAVLEEEVIRLEEQLVNFRQGLYQEAVYISSSKKSIENVLDSCSPQSFYNFKKEQCKSSLEDMDSALTSRVTIFDPRDLCSFHRLPSGRKQQEENGNEVGGKENQSNTNSVTFNESPVSQRDSQNHNSTMNLESKSSKEHFDSGKVQLECRLFEHNKAEIDVSDTGNDMILVENDKDNPNELSENIMKCLKSIFMRMKIPKGKSGCLSSKGFKDVECNDPYEICSEFGKRDVGPYKHLRVIEMSSVDHNRITDSSSLMKKLRRLLGKLVLVDLHGLTHQQKLAFWINIYNSCMMNAFLENGIPKEPEMVLQLMKKASINVSGHVLNAMTIEHFILRLPHHSRHSHVNFKGLKNEELAARSIFGLDFREPLVTFALSCGSWSSPAVKIYTADQVENEMEAAKRDYLQAAIGISTANKLAIPKLLDWYLLDFAKDIESLLDWICLQLPDGLSKEALKCLEKVRKDSPLQSIQVIPYEFTFRYLLDP